MSDYTSVAATTLAVTLQDAKSHLNVSSTFDDALITSQIKAATLLLEQATNRCFVTQTRVMKLDSFSDPKYVRNRRIYLERSPIRNSTAQPVSVTYLDDAGASTTLPTSDYVVSTNDQPAFVAEASGAAWPTVYTQPNSVTVTYVAGHSTVSSGIPENIKQAVRMLVATWYQNRETEIVSGAIPKELAYSVSALMESERTERYV